MEANGAETAAGAYSASKASKFRFKSKRSRTEEDASHHRKRYRHSHSGSEDAQRHSRRRHRHTHRSTYRKDQPSPSKKDRDQYDDAYDAHDSYARTSHHVEPDATFRESLFDALADDEGAAYWEGVYGQPVHIYSNTKPGPEGELERMTDEEYAEYVRGKMWEKSHQHIIEERERKEREKKKRKKAEDQAAREGAKLETEREEFQKRMEESLRRGEKRKAARSWKEAWEKYETRWEELKGRLDHEAHSDKNVEDLVPWPVQSGKRRDISREEIEGFFRHAPSAEEGLRELLKTERVKWHPDKIQQRFGERIEAETMKSVTAVFQVIDVLWSEQRGRR